jgi:glutamate-ammonia-ligase adenylyltransferase
MSGTDVEQLLRALATGAPDDETARVLAALGFEDVARAFGNLRRMAEVVPGQFPALAPRLLPAVATSPDPDMALNNLERMLPACDDPAALARVWTDSPPALNATVQVGASSQLLADILVETAPRFRESVAAGDWPAPRTAEDLEREVGAALAALSGREARLNALRRFKRQELLRIGSRDILRVASFGELVAEISDLAAVCLRSALGLAWDTAPRPEAPADAPEDWWREFAVLAMGKLGGHELNYSSDVDLLFVYDAPWCRAPETPEPVRRYFAGLATALTAALGNLTADGALFRVDLRLRPEGGAGTLVRSLGSYEAYYESWGAAWERQALIKASGVAGNRELADRFLALAERFVYGKRLDTEGVAEIKSVKARVEASARRAGGPDVAQPSLAADVKLGPGCIRDIEFTVQFLQLIFGTGDPRVRRKSTLGALRALVEGKYLSATEHQTLASAYVFLRTVEHQLQLMHGLSTRRLPADEPAQGKLARRLGLQETEGTPPATLLLSEYRRHTESARSLFEKLFSEMFEVRDDTDLRVRSLVLSREEAGPAAEAVLADYGVTDTARGAAILRRLAHGTISAPLPASAAERFADLAPIALQAAARTPDPDASLGNFEEFCGLIGSHGALYGLLARQPKTTEMLVRVAGCSASLSAILAHHPEYFDMLMDAGVMGPPRRRAEVAAELEERLEGVADPAARVPAIHRFRRRELLRVGVRDLMNDADTETTLRELTQIAEVCLGGILDAAARRVAGRSAGELPLAVIGLGKLGGGEMHYNSDLDVLFVWEDRGADREVDRLEPVLREDEGGEVVRWGHEVFTRLASEVLGGVGVGSLGVGPPLNIDARLRPEGQSGPLARSLEAYAAYYAGRAESWERMALVRRRAIAGDEAVGRAFEAVVTPFLWGHGLTAGEIEQILHAKGRIERERAQTGPGVVDLKLGPGGINDIEFCVQLLQLAHGHEDPKVRVPGTLAGLRALARRDRLPRPEDATRLEAAYLFLRRAESRLQIVHDWDESTISPRTGGFEKLARLLGYPNDPPGSAAERFAEELRHHQAVAREVFEETVAGLQSGGEPR